MDTAKLPHSFQIIQFPIELKCEDMIAPRYGLWEEFIVGMRENIAGFIWKGLD